MSAKHRQGRTVVVSVATSSGPASEAEVVAVAAVLDASPPEPEPESIEDEATRPPAPPLRPVPVDPAACGSYAAPSGGHRALDPTQCVHRA